MDDKTKEALRLVRKIEIGEKEEFKLTEGISLVLENIDDDIANVELKLGDNILNLSNLVPNKKVKFQLGNDFSIHFSNPPLIVVAVQELRKNPNRVLGLFHEIGHAIRRTNQDPSEVSELETAVKKMNDAIMQWKDVNKVLSKRERGLIVDDERMGWTNALLLIRKIRRETGCDLFRIFDSKGQLRKEMHSRLSTYEQRLLDDTLTRKDIKQILEK